MSKIEVDAIDKQSGSTLTLGGSGTAVTLACGATQTGFGRTGTVNWVTTKKTANFTAVSGEGYFCDTAAVGAFTLTLPSSPSAGDIVGLKDYNGNFATANLTIGRGGSPINGANSADPAINTDGASIFLVYVDASQGWVATQDDSSTFSGQSFIVATGGTISCSGSDRIHTFTGPGTFCVSSVSVCAPSNAISYLMAAGGGGGGTNTTPGAHAGGGGGAGGVREVKSPATPYTASPIDGYGTPGNRVTVSVQGYPIQVGGGGPAATSNADQGDQGTPTVAFSLTATGGGGGGSPSGAPNYPGTAGGSGGGGASEGCGSGGAGNTPPITPPQGNNGGTGVNSPPNLRTGGGGGATAIGDNGAINCRSGNGGAGATTEITGSSSAFGGGGGGGHSGPSGQQPGGTGGTGGGGPGTSPASPGTANTGGGGGGGAYPGSPGAGGQGGPGVVIIRYKART